ncbi:MAG: hypothetical protein H7210_05355 [Pyrinomonadaceae bacterium]|nr:hypothetical protein [Phycisphaerales bacterium]
MRSRVAYRAMLFGWFCPAVAIVVIMLIVFTYCRLTRCSRAAVAGAKDLNIGRDIAKMYPSAINSIMYCTGKYGPPTWQSEIGFFDRYILTVQVPVHISYFGSHIVASGEPELLIVEIQSIQVLPSGQAMIDNAGGQMLTKEQWNSLVGSSRSIEAIIPNCNKIPVPNFKQAFSHK